MYKLINIGTQANSQIREYIADTEDDIASLPDGDPFGSTVFVIETSTTYMKNSAGEYVEIVVSGGSGGGSKGPLICSATQVDNRIEIDKTAKEVFDAALEGRCVQVALNMDGMAITVVIPMEAFRFVTDENELYIIKARADTQPADTLYMSDPLMGTDIVVLKEVTT